MNEDVKGDNRKKPVGPDNRHGLLFLMISAAPLVKTEPHSNLDTPLAPASACARCFPSVCGPPLSVISVRINFVLT